MARDIPGNKHALERLRMLLVDHEGIAFVGAGASAGLYPLWAPLVVKLADEAVNRGLATPADRDFWLSSGTKSQQAVRGIKQALGSSIYSQILREVFKPKRGLDGNRYTPIHAALVNLPFRGLVTTNYDPGLLEARLDLRRDNPGTGYATWQDADAVERWLTGDIFKEEALPILFAHGSYERGHTIVLGSGEYREAYKPGAYRRLFDKLWSQDRLVFVGFGFSDPWLDYLAQEVITQTAALAAGEPRHIALIGLDDETPYTPEMRRAFHDQYNAMVYFYTVTKGPGGAPDHSELRRMLEELGSQTKSEPRSLSERPPPPSERPPPPSERPLPQWTHETTNDDRYVERADAIHRLDRWAAEPEVRAIAVTGMGGQGKTSLVGYWLKRLDGAADRRGAGLFFWSFYVDRSVESFLGALLGYAKKIGKLPVFKPDVGLVERARALLRATPMLVILDGLEVLQERPGTEGYGELLDDDLREFLDGACRTSGGGFVILTSRFPFTDLVPYIGSSLRSLDLDRLSDEEGAALLERCDVGGTPKDRRAVSFRFEGHPLALRVFAAALSTQGHRDPSRLDRVLFEQGSLRDQEPLERKLKHLLLFYERQLPAERVVLLGLVALFRAPVDEATIRRLIAGLPVARKMSAIKGREALRQHLRRLCVEHLLVMERSDQRDDEYTCHPVLRDHFRSALLARSAEVAGEAAVMLTERPVEAIPKSIHEIEPVLTAIELLLEAGNFERADALYRERLANGKVFWSLPAFRDGIRCALGFVTTPEREQKCEQSLSAERLSFYLNEVGLYAMKAGETDYALQYFEASLTIDRKIRDKRYLSIGLQNMSGLMRSMGRLEAALSAAEEALSFATAVASNREQVDSLAHYGDCLSKLGRTREAVVAFERASGIPVKVNTLHGRNGIWWADLLLRLGHHEDAAGNVVEPRRQKREISQLTSNYLTPAGESKSFYSDNDARWFWILGRLRTSEGSYEEAAGYLAKAESTMRRGHMLQELPPVLLACAELHRKRKAFDEALRDTEEALRIAAPRELRLSQADALIQRGRITLDRARQRSSSAGEAKRAFARAHDDGEAGVALARECGYAWAELAGLTLLTETNVGRRFPGVAKVDAREVQALRHRIMHGNLNEAAHTEDSSEVLPVEWIQEAGDEETEH